MKDIDIAALFCEVLSGLCIIVIAVLFLDLTEVISLPDVIIGIDLSSMFSLLSGALVAAYIIGIVVDALGMAFDGVVNKKKWLTSCLGYTGKLPDYFYAKAQLQQFAFWKETWTYFSCYRNLFMLSVLWAPLGISVVYKYSNWLCTILMTGICFISIVSLIATIRELQRAMVFIVQLPPGISNVK